MNFCVKIALTAAGSISVGLGALGMFLPLLPTTPFLLLAALCYARSSRRVYRWLMTHRFFGQYIRNYREGRGIPFKEKMLVMTVLWLTIGFSAGFVVSPLWGKLLLLCIAVGVSAQRLTVTTYHPEGS